VVDAWSAAGGDVRFITLTRPTQDLSTDPRLGISGTRALWRTARQRLRRDVDLAGGLVRWEATWHGRDGMRLHCHAHVVALISNHNVDATAHRLIAAWRRAAADASIATSVAAQDAQTPRGDANAVAHYVLKYIQKPGEAKSPPALALAAHAWRGVRVLDWWGACHARSTAASPLRDIVAAAKAADAVERARWSLARVGEDAVASMNRAALCELGLMTRRDIPHWHPVLEYVRACERGRPLAELRALAAALPLAATVAAAWGEDVSGLPGAPAGASPLDSDDDGGDDGDDDD
jgi:hypothetical protein